MAKEQRLGLWWKPENPEMRWAGNLNIGIDDDIYSELELLSQGIRGDFAHHELLHGYTAGELYSALNVFNHQFSVKLGSSTSGLVDKYLVRDVIEGTHLDHHGQEFKRFSFSVTGLQDWSRISGISKTLSQVQGDPAIGVQFTRTAPAPVEVETNVYRFRFFSTMKMPNEPWSMSLAEDTQIHVTAQVPMSIGDWLFEVVLPFRRLIQYCARSGGTLQRLAVSNYDGDDSSRERDWFKIIRSGTKQYLLDTRQLRINPPILQLPDFSEQTDALQKWYDFDRSFREPLTAVLDSVLGSPTHDYVFFVHARFLERLVSHYPQAEICDKETMNKIVKFAKSLVEEDKRDVLGQKIGLQRRNDAKVPLRACLDAWLPSMSSWNPDDDELEWVTSKIVKTRNHFAHHGTDEPDPKTIKSWEFSMFTDLVATLVDFEIASRLGFTGELVMSRLENSPQWHSIYSISQAWLEHQQETNPNEGQSDWPEA